MGVISIVIVEIKGGLGNQMFQYAFALWLKENGKRVKLDVSHYKKDHSNEAVDSTHNGFELQTIFDCSLPLASTKESDMLVNNHPDFYHKALWSIFNITPSHIIIFDTKKWFLPQLKEKDWCYFDGYWVSFRYADEIARTLKDAFEFKTDLGEKNRTILKEIENCNSVSLHIRRGDYLNISRYVVLPVDYYNTAIKELRNNTSTPVFYCFSDDIEWCKANLHGTDIRYVDWNQGSDSYIDMLLMSHCKHNVVSNSTFSMWAAWLNNNHAKIVYRPSKYYADSSNEREDTWPGSWKVIDI